MGPLYGSMFRSMARAVKNNENIDSSALENMLTTASQAITELGEAKVGDKTLVDTLEPASQAVTKARSNNKSFLETIDEMIAAAEKGWRSTEAMVAKIGRSARLGERSKGVLDAGATSCFLLLKSMGKTMKELIQ